MSSVLNKYATNVFAEHPIGLWSLDDTCDYISLLPVTDQNLNNWTTSETIVDATDYGVFGKILEYQAPFENNFVNGIEVSGGTASFVSNIQLQESDFNYDHGSVSISFYICPFDKDIDITFGYQYVLDAVTVQETRTSSVSATTEWALVSSTLDLPPTGFQDLEMFIYVDYQVVVDPYKFAINGITFGQLSENFQSTSLGSYPELISGISGISSQGIVANDYGIGLNNGYYLTDGTTIFAKNSGFPLVYGTENSTVIISNNGDPSLIVPGFGFLNQSKKYQEFTLEFWARIQSNATVERRIAGPIGSTDGIYVDGAFLKLKVGQNVGSYFVGEWDRPMLIDFRMSQLSASIVLNGETVIYLDFDTRYITFSEVEDEFGDSLDWIGFYAYDDIPKIEIDCVGIYPYQVPALASKRRWIFGQAVTVPDNIEGINSANSVFIDYPFAEYSKNYSYPKTSRWNNGSSDNLYLTSSELNVPDYSLPSFRFNNKSESEWNTAIHADQGVGDPFISLKPTGFENTDGHIFFSSLNFVKDGLKGFFGVFELVEEAEEEQTLFELKDDLFGKSIIASISGDIVSYKLRYLLPSGETQEDLLYSNIGVNVGDKFMAGIDIDRFSAFYGKTASSFFGNAHQTKVYFGGSAGFLKTFSGKIHRISFCNKKNFSVASSLFTFFGLPAEYENVFDYYESSVSYDAGAAYFGEDPDYWSLSFDGGDPYPFEGEAVLIDKNEHIGTYTLVASNNLEQFALDIEVDSSWQDYVPLTYFGKYVKNAKDQNVFALDFLQFNIDYPKLNNLVDGVYDTSQSFVKTYVSFQYLSTGANATSSSFDNIEPLSYTNVISPGTEWINTKYEVLNNTVIYLPPDVDFKKIAIVTHIDIKVPGINKYPIRLKSLQYSSQALGASATKIGTRFGKAIYPYRKIGQYYKYDAKNPISIYKGSTPHMYLTENSGIRINSEYSKKEYGISIPLNKNAASFFKIASMQIAIKYDYEFPTVPIKLFEIDSKDSLMAAFLVADPTNNSRAQIYAVNMQTGKIDANVVFFINGKVTSRPFINRNQWYYLGMTFFPILDFDNYFGGLRITSPILINNLSFYQVRSEENLEQTNYRSWYGVSTDSLTAESFDWAYWTTWNDINPTEGSRWRYVLYAGLKPSQLAFNAENIYKIYTGTNSQIFDSDYTISVGNYRYTSYKDLNWSKQTIEAV